MVAKDLRGHSENCYKPLVEYSRDSLGCLILGYHGQSIPGEVIGDDKDILDTRFVELHGGFHTFEIHVDELQWCVGLNRA